MDPRYIIPTVQAAPVRVRETELEYFHRLAAERQRAVRDHRRRQRRAHLRRTLRRVARPHGRG